jgi:triphosphatase
MAVEVELKLTLSPHHVDSLKSQPLFRSKAIKALGEQHLKNTYFDTPDQLLTQHKIALRIREKGTQLIQTLKTNGTTEAGLHSRKEWEWLLQAPQLDYDLLQSAEWPEALREPAVQASIGTVFSTDFTRTLWLLDTLDIHGNPLKAEIALDQGSVDYADKHDPICELELELLEGDPAELVRITAELAKHVPLLVSDVSKAERGYRLHNPEQYRVVRKAQQAAEEEPLEALFCRLLMNELSLWPRYFDAWHFTRDWDNITQALESLRNTDALYESFSSIIPPEPESTVSQLLIKLIRQLRDLDSWRRAAELTASQQSLWYQQQAEKAASRVDVLLQTAQPGLLALLIAQQLIERPWRQRWSTQHQQNAQEPLK